MMRVLSAPELAIWNTLGPVRYLTRSGSTEVERVVASRGHVGGDRWSGDYCPVIRWRNSM
jgi:hypothetical protein